MPILQSLLINPTLLRVKQALIEIVPPWLLMPLIVAYKYFTRRIDPELSFFLSSALQGNRFVDIGSNVGVYSYLLSSKFLRVEAFEPHAHLLRPLQQSLKTNICTHPAALSSMQGYIDIHTPVHNSFPLYALSSLIPPSSGRYQSKKVKVYTLDSFSYDDVDLIKIDAEGHELSIIDGALNTIKKCRPILIVEIEQRHNQCSSITETFQSILSLGYSCFFLRGGNLIPLSEFVVERDQQISLLNTHMYINNFIFYPQ